MDLSLAAGPNEIAPLVHDGVLFVFGFGDHVEALEAASGDLLWEYSRPLPKEVQPSVQRNLALDRDRLFVPASDSHLVALDIKTGKVIGTTRSATTTQASASPAGRSPRKAKSSRESRAGAGRQLHPGTRCRDGPGHRALLHHRLLPCQGAGRSFTPR